MLYQLYKNDIPYDKLVNQKQLMVILENERVRCVMAGKAFQLRDKNGIVEGEFLGNRYLAEPIKYANQA